MPWRCINTTCSIKIFTVSTIFKNMTYNILEFFISLSPGVYLFLLISIIAVFVLYLFFYIRRVMMLEDV